VLPSRVAGATRPDAALDLALRLRCPRRAGVDVEAQRLREAAVRRVDLAPGPSTARHRGLLVVHAHCRRHPAKALERAHVALLPRELVLARRPDRRRSPRVAQPQVERVQVDLLASDPHAAVLSPVGLSLRARRGLHAPASSDRRLRKVLAHVPLHRPQAARIAVLGDQPVVQRRQVGAFAGTHPFRDHRRPGRRLVRLPAPAVHRCLRGPRHVVAHRALRHRQHPGDLRVRNALPLQRRDRHPTPPVELGHRRGLPGGNAPRRQVRRDTLVDLGVALARKVGVA
jgi:hypothetical protein